MGDRKIFFLRTRKREREIEGVLYMYVLCNSGGTELRAFSYFAMKNHNTLSPRFRVIRAEL